MRESTNQKSKRKAPIICAVVMVGFLAIWLAAIIFPLLGGLLGETAVFVLLLIYVFVIVAVMVGVLLALRQRLREIEGGEEEEAKQY